MFFIIFPFISSCMSLPREEKYANQIINNFAKRQKKINNLQVKGTGGCIPNRVKSLFISFDMYEKLTLEEAREKYISIIDDFVEYINQDGRLANYSQNWPFTEKNVDVNLAFTSRNEFIDPPYIAFICVCNETICYAQNKRGEKGNPLVTFHKETFEEAKKIIQSK